MRHRVPCLAYLLCCTTTLAGCAQSRDAAPTDTAASTAAGGEATAQGGSAEQDIRRMLDEYVSAYFRGDTAALQRFEADDFVVLSAYGPEDRAGRYAAIDSARRANKWFPQPVTYESRDVTVRQYGDAATAYGWGITTIPGEGRSEFAVSSLWVRRGGPWEVVQYHFTEAAKPSGAGAAAKK